MGTDEYMVDFLHTGIHKPHTRWHDSALTSICTHTKHIHLVLFCRAFTRTHGRALTNYDSSVRHDRVCMCVWACVYAKLVRLFRPTDNCCKCSLRYMRVCVVCVCSLLSSCKYSSSSSPMCVCVCMSKGCTNRHNSRWLHDIWRFRLAHDCGSHESWLISQRICMRAVPWYKFITG